LCSLSAVTILASNPVLFPSPAFNLFILLCNFGRIYWLFHTVYVVFQRRDTLVAYLKYEGLVKVRVAGFLFLFGLQITPLIGYQMKPEKREINLYKSTTYSVPPSTKFRLLLSHEKFLYISNMNQAPYRLFT